MRAWHETIFHNWKSAQIQPIHEVIKNSYQIKQHVVNFIKENMCLMTSINIHQTRQNYCGQTVNIIIRLRIILI